MDKFELNAEAVTRLAPVDDPGEAGGAPPKNPFLSEAGGPRGAPPGGMLFMQSAPIDVELIKRLIEGLKLL